MKEEPPAKCLGGLKKPWWRFTYDFATQSVPGVLAAQYRAAFTLTWT